MLLPRVTLLGLMMFSGGPLLADSGGVAGVSYGPRPFYLIDKMEEGALKQKLSACMGQAAEQTKFSIGHRGAPLMFPEHTVEANKAAARMGAGLLECDVTFTADKALVCRHSQNDLHTTTNIVATALDDKCTTPFQPASDGGMAKAECRTSDLTLDEFRTLKPKMDAANVAAATAEEYLGGTASWRTDLFASDATMMTHADSITLFDSLGADFIPELKYPTEAMPYDGMSQEDYAQSLINDYKAAGIDPSRVWAQSFNLQDVLYWAKAEPDFGKQAVYLMSNFRDPAYDANAPETWPKTMTELKQMGVNYIAPPMWMLITLEEGKIVPNALAKAAKEADLGIFTWTLERSGFLSGGGGWYFQSVRDVIDVEGDYYEVLDVLAQDVGVKGVFSDWPATVTYYANCMGL